MKIRILKLHPVCAIIIASVFLISCSTDVEPLDPAVDLNPPVDSGVFKVDFNNQTFTASATTAYISSNNIIINGTRGSVGEGISIIIDDIAVGNYNGQNSMIVYNPSINSDFDYSSIDMSNENFQNTSNVTISSIDMTNKIITGTFSFTGFYSDFSSEDTLPSINFTNGVFSIPFVTDNPVTTDEFYAKIDGVEFNEELIMTALSQQGTTGTISISAIDANENMMVISIKDEAVIGENILTDNPFVDSVRMFYVLNNQNSPGVSGSLTLLSRSNDRVKGTFHFVTGSGISITEGSFDVEY